ncbi:MAG: hypothetical protein EPN86_03475 [Nanoarchaeota archaeon]|nr:MAG: hypothetical protein EPN86_03475 [Nanoarchaeota archaeon]
MDERRPLAEAEELYNLFMNLEFTPQVMFDYLMSNPELAPQTSVLMSLDISIDNENSPIKIISGFSGLKKTANRENKLNDFFNKERQRI